MNFEILTTGSWLLAAFVLLSSFSGCLVSFLTASEKPWIPKTFDELASAVKSGQYKCGVFDNFAAQSFIMTSKNENLFILKKHMISNNIFFEDNQGDDVIKSLRNRNFAIISGYEALLKLKRELQENVFISDDALLSFNIAFPMRKGFSYRKEVNKMLSSWIAAGITGKVFEFAFPDDEYENAAEEIKPLKLNEFGGAFILLFIGYILSFSSFISELMIAKITKRIFPTPVPH
ncbi:uncharacterized protein [Centruroides vittatus]|uniref:uncharacterized protein n=1 Tax=Centruroides vittatus TaxID=120091 RepID=UPI00351023DE